MVIVPGLGKARTGASLGLAKALAAHHISRMTEDTGTTAKETPKQAPDAAPKRTGEPREIGGPKGPEPTRYGDWEQNGRCTDF